MTTKKCCTCSSSDNDAQRYRHLDDILKEYRDKPGALIPVLQMAQGLFGYLPEAVLKKISLGLDTPFSEVAGVVSFYSFFSTNPRGEHLIRVCLGTACYVRGGKQVLDAIKKKLGIEVGETTPDNKFSLEVARCFGACGLAPTMSIDNEVYKRVRPIKINEIIDKYYRKRKTAAAKG